VTVRWQEGKGNQDLTVVQYVTNPMQGGLDPETLEPIEPDESGSETGSGSTPTSSKPTPRTPTSGARTGGGK